MRFAIIAAVGALALGGCTTTTISNYPALAAAEPAPRKIVVVIDGTGNDQTSRTNAARLYELAVNQNRPGLSVFYTEGVGTDGRVVGAVTGWGIGHDVRRAYRFVAEQWEPDAKLHIVGFSRGAYAGRMLAGLLDTAGIADLSARPGETEKARDKRARRLIGRIYDAYKTKPIKGEEPEAELKRRRDAIGDVPGFKRRNPGQVRVAALALWDTVEALAAPDGRDDMFEANDRYVDQLCNVDRAFHALALDDNRAYSFTPLSLVSKNRRRLCPTDVRPLESFVDEVWFAGAHADVGGSYADGRGTIDGYLSGVSMNWMLARLEPYKILPENSAQYAEPLDVIHNAKKWTRLYKPLDLRYRDPFRFARDSENTTYNDKKPRVHISVEERLAVSEALDARHGARCGPKRKRAQSLMCRADIAAMPFFRDLEAGECLEPIVQNGVRIGYRFAGPRTVIPGTDRIDTKCVTLITDRPAP